MSSTSGVDPKDAIINVLQTGPKDPSELKREVLKLGVSRSTYHYTLRKLIDRGEVEDAKYSYKGSRVSDTVVQEILGPITASTEPQQNELSKNLEFLATKAGIALKALFLPKIEECLTSKLVEVRRSALSALSMTLWNLSESPEDNRAREEINKRFFTILEKVVRIEKVVRSDDDFDVKGRAIKILAALGDSRAVDILIDVVARVTDDDYQKLKIYIKEAIVSPYHPSRRPRNYLTRYYQPKILIRLSELAAQGNKRASELADLIRHGASDWI